ncbi:MAG: M28 family metallopeptidase [Candidatus Bathyarchaeota archaeon]|nr:M28 family metallopeptidase [Candidatus Bathyarchaeota archaeon]MDH5787428.1 M28 family metallopeptidase [Candidatus Bathyarchaeota archaeon]
MKFFDAGSAYHFMERLVKEIGNRESGTDSERRAAQQIKAWFEEFELANVRMEEFEVQTSRILKEEVSLPDGTQLECAAVGNSLSTPPQGIEGEVVMLESTSSGALKNIENKIAALSVVLYEKDFCKVMKAGPQALIYPSRTPLAPTIYRSIRAEYVEKQNIPAVSMAHDDVLSVLKGPKRLKIITEVQSVTAKSQNVLGEVPGSLEDEDILVGGHYDTVRSVMGAHDNAAGTAVMLELARIFAHEKLNRKLRIVAFGSEELGLRGSFHHAENPDNTKNLTLCFDFDVHGILLGTLNAVVLGPEELRSLLRFTAKELGIPLQVTNELGMGGSDHMPLAFYGVPSVMLSRAGGAAQIMHTELEDLRWCGSDAFISIGKLSQTLLERLLRAEELPFEKKVPNDITKAIEKRFEDSGIKKKAKEGVE